MSEAERPPWRGEVAALGHEITKKGERLAEVDETLSRCVDDFKRLERQVGEVAQLLANFSRDQEGQFAENERFDQRLDALSQDAETQRHAVVELETHLDDLTTLVRELAERQAAETKGERATWWSDLPAGEERTQALRLLGAWVDEVLRGHHPELFKDSLQACWYRHDDVLDELAALRAAWYAAYRGKTAPAAAAIEWHDRWLPGCMARCKAAIEARLCDMDGHHSPPGIEAFYDSAAFKEFTEHGPER